MARTAGQSRAARAGTIGVSHRPFHDRDRHEAFARHHCHHLCRVCASRHLVRGVRAGGARGRARGVQAAGGPVAARPQHHQRGGARLPAAGQQVGRQPDRLPRGRRHQTDRRQGRNLRRDLRHRAHAGRQGRAHRRVREPEAHQDRFPVAAGSRRCLWRGFAEAVRLGSQDDLARPPQRIAGARRHQAADRRGAEQSAAGPRQLLARDPRADRRRAGDEAGAEQLALPARHQHPRADSAGRLRQQLLHPRLRRLAVGKLPRRAVVAGVHGSARTE